MSYDRIETEKRPMEQACDGCCFNHGGDDSMCHRPDGIGYCWNEDQDGKISDDGKMYIFKELE